MRVQTEFTGKRLLVSLIDEYARDDPKRIWASKPIDYNDITKGFRDITYKEFANAINHAARWLQSNVSDKGIPFETVAYAGPKDLRYPIITVAALKCGKKILLCSPFASAIAQNHMFDITACTTYMHDASFGPLVKSVLGEGSNMTALAIPELNEWLFQEEDVSFPYTKTWDEANQDPWIIFHTSGTTGLPKPVIYTNMMMTSFDAAELMPDQDEENMNDLFRNQRYYVTLPTLHFVGMTAALQWTVFLNIVLLAGPPGNINESQIRDVLVHGKAEGALMPPGQIEAVSNVPGGLETLRSLNCIYFAGAPMPRFTAEKFVGHTKVFPGMGSTEAGAYFVQVRNDVDDWEYYNFRPSIGVEFDKKPGGLYELVFRKKEGLERWQQVFMVYPQDKEFPTKDLWAPHPDKPGCWKYMGRTDDLVIFSHGEGLYATEMEAAIMKHPDVKTALVGGEGKPRPFVLIELQDKKELSFAEKQAKLAEIWPCFEKANELCSDYVKLSRRLVLFADPKRPFPLTAKETVLKRAALTLYRDDIDNLYSEPMV